MLEKDKGKKGKEGPEKYSRNKHVKPQSFSLSFVVGKCNESKRARMILIDTDMFKDNNKEFRQGGVTLKYFSIWCFIIDFENVFVCCDLVRELRQI